MMWRYAGWGYYDIVEYVDVALGCGCKAQVHPYVVQYHYKSVVCPEHEVAVPYVVDPWQMSA